MRKRPLKTGEVVKKTDEYISVHTPGTWGPVQKCTVGKAILECNVKYYRRPMEAREA